MRSSLRFVPAVFWLGPVLGLVLVSGCGEGNDSASGPGTSAGTPSAAASELRTTSAGTSSPARSGAGTTDAGTTGTAPSRADYRPISESPAQEEGLDLGYLEKVTAGNGVVTLLVDRRKMYVGAEADARNRAAGNPPNDFFIADPDGEGQELSFVLDPKASLFAEVQLRNGSGDQVGRQKLSRSSFLHNAGREEALPTLVWLRHTDGLEGPVTALAEQFIP
jgi:hypothetical protein